MGNVMIDFEAEFQKYIKVWMKSEGLSKDDYALVDDRLAEIYEKWLHSPSDDFGGKAPYNFFDGIDSPINLYKLLGKYIFSDKPVPGPLLNRMIKLKEGVYPLIIDTLEKFDDKDKNSDKFRTYCIELIGEMNMEYPLDSFIETIKNTAVKRESTESMVEVLKNNLSDIKGKLKTAYNNTEFEYAKDSFLDIMSLYAGDKDAYELILDCFLNDFSKSGMYAQMLSKIGNSDCTSYLVESLKDPSINYINFCRVKEALEELGEETNIERDFSGDADYEYMLKLASEEEDPKLEIEEDFDE